MTTTQPDPAPAVDPAPSVDAAREIVALLVASGVREVVLSPGSRSAPLAYALAAAEHAGLLRLHVRIDERAAGFLALGLARGAQVRARTHGALEGGAGPALAPVVVVTTSGTAVANLHPAVLEAHHGAVPILVLSADRPHELWGTGANQTTRQPGIFGPATRLEATVPAPSGRDGEAADLRALVARACAAATGALGATPPGPVHLDLAYRDPLAPAAGGGDALEAAARDVAGRAARLRPVRVVGTLGGEARRSRASFDDTRLAPADVELLRSLAHEPRTVVVAGDDAGPVAALVAEARGWPLVAEITSGAAGSSAAVRRYRTVLDERADLVAEVRQVVVLGRPTLSRQVGRLLRAAPLVVTVAPVAAQVEPGWPDPERATGVVLPGIPDAWLVAGPRTAASESAAGGAEPTTEPTTSVWAQRWLEAAARLTTLDQAPDRAAQRALLVAPPVTPDRLAAAVLAATGDGVLVVGSSNPVRDLDAALGTGPGPWAVPTVVANRGLAGIDGIVSTSTGVALALDVPVRALLGDLTFLHDVGGLWRGDGEAPPRLQLVVANDRGGSIFADLEHGALAASGPQAARAFARVFTTPHTVDLESLCAGYGVTYARADSEASLEAALAAPPDGLSVLEVIVVRGA